MEQNRFVHGGDVYSFERCYHRAPIDFSVNINPLGMPEEALVAYRKAEKDLSLYPDPVCRSLVQKLAEFDDIMEGAYLCGNGAADLIYRMVYAAQPKKALLTAPAFSEYERALKAVDAEIDFHPLLEEDGFALTEAILPQIAGHDILILCNPNNPTGTVTGKKLMTQILKECNKQECLLCIDECFMDFVQERVTMKKECYENTAYLIILKAFTKTYAMPGLRLGYCISHNRELLYRMSLCGPFWNVSVPALACGEAALNDKTFLRKTRSFLKEERRRLIDRVTKLGATVYGSKANYIFFRHPDENLYQKLCERGFLIRDCANFRGLEKGYYRIAVRTEEENEALLVAMRQIAAEENGGKTEAV